MLVSCRRLVQQQRVRMSPVISRGIVRRVKPRKKVWQPKEEDEVPCERYRKELSEEGLMKKAGMRRFYESDIVLEEMIQLRFFDEAEMIANVRLDGLSKLSEQFPDNAEYSQLLVREQFRYAGILAERKKLDEALNLYQVMEGNCLRLHGELHIGSDAIRNNMGTVLSELSRHDDAEPLFRKVLDHAEGEYRLVVGANLVDLLRETGRLEAASELVQIEGKSMDGCNNQEIRLRWATSEALLDHAMLPTPNSRRRVERLVSQMNKELGPLNSMFIKFSGILDALPAGEEETAKPLAGEKETAKPLGAEIPFLEAKPYNIHT